MRPDGFAYEGDELRRSAVERQLENIGEAVKNLRNRDPAVQQIPEASRIIGLRNILAHRYTITDDAETYRLAEREGGTGGGLGVRVAGHPVQHRALALNHCSEPTDARSPDQLIEFVPAPRHL